MVDLQQCDGYKTEFGFCRPLEKKLGVTDGTGWDGACMNNKEETVLHVGGRRMNPKPSMWTVEWMEDATTTKMKKSRDKSPAMCAGLCRPSTLVVCADLCKPTKTSKGQSLDFGMQLDPKSKKKTQVIISDAKKNVQ